MSQRLYRVGTMVRMNKFNKAKNPVKHAIQNWNIVSGDHIQIIEGRDAGKRGVVERVLRHRNLIFVAGMKKAVRYTKPTDENGNQMLPELKEKSIHYSNVQLIDPVTNKPTRVSKKRDEATGKLVRVSVRSGAIIPTPGMNWTTPKKTNPLTDTPSSEVTKVTYVEPEWMQGHLKAKELAVQTRRAKTLTRLGDQEGAAAAIARVQELVAAASQVQSEAPVSA